MATHSNLPFRLVFHQWDRKAQQVGEVAVENFFTTPHQDFDDAPKVMENLDLEVTFSCNDPQARLYIDFFDVSDMRVGFEMDEHRALFLRPDEEKVLLYKVITEETDFYPLIPGGYRIRVEAFGQTYHSMIMIIPKELKFTEWEVMRDELEAEMRGLAQDLIRRNLGAGDPFLKHLPPEQLFRFVVIRNRYQALLGALQDVKKRANYRIEKNYQLVPPERAKAIDEKSVRAKLTHPERRDLKTPVRELNYRLPENHWVKHICLLVARYLEEIADSFARYRAALLEEVSHYRDEDNEGRTGGKWKMNAYIRAKKQVAEGIVQFETKIAQMRSGLRLLESAEWYGEVPAQLPTAVTPVLTLDPRYRTFYQLYRELKSETYEVSLDTIYAYQWKKSDLMYEMWCYLKVTRYLIDNLGYEPAAGWVFDQDFQGSRILIPMLPDGTKIVLQKGDVRLHHVFNARIPHKPHPDPNEHPLHMLASAHNKPDGRIDVYHKDVYAGSLILEFKYRPNAGRNKFWNPSGYPTPYTTGQIISYFRDSASTHLLTDGGDRRLIERTRPVHEVWAMYPRQIRDLVEEYEDYHVKLIVMTPGTENEHVNEYLERALAEIVNIKADI
ncbi:hypothetical protein CBW65_03840 [Tumebacillus avium]|uniref:DUF2357 domain-containing protein n=1 Tax=Tumebacillus avium TaxID=1903704 RepID=A0A1Y0IJ06_9BACL|nr:DUF2357 domain-containing protein [Tumebacillus avium]ARU60290.1 hypothetical protein CBW65_03840 [Tumebacillus avium]